MLIYGTYIFVILLFAVLLIQLKGNTGQKSTDSITIDEKQYWFELESSGKEFYNFKIRNTNNDTLFLKEIIDSKKLIIYNPFISCQPCFDSMLAATSEMFGNSKDKVIVLSKFHSLRHAKLLLLKNNNASFPVYDILEPKPKCILDKTGGSVAFLCDSSLIMRNLFVFKPQKEKLLRKYLTSVGNILRAD